MKMYEYRFFRKKRKELYVADEVLGWPGKVIVPDGLIATRLKRARPPPEDKNRE